jgi:hypothetical protein
VLPFGEFGELRLEACWYAQQEADRRFVHAVRILLDKGFVTVDKWMVIMISLRYHNDVTVRSFYEQTDCG